MSLLRLFPDGRVVLHLPVEDLAYDLLPYFRSLPGRSRGGALSCVAHQAAHYPVELRPSLIAALIAAWDFLELRGLLGPDELLRARWQRDHPVTKARWIVEIIAHRVV